MWNIHIAYVAVIIGKEQKLMILRKYSLHKRVLLYWKHCWSKWCQGGSGFWGMTISNVKHRRRWYSLQYWYTEIYRLWYSNPGQVNWFHLLRWYWFLSNDSKLETKWMQWSPSRLLKRDHLSRGKYRYCNKFGDHQTKILSIQLIGLRPAVWLWPL